MHSPITVTCDGCQQEIVGTPGMPRNDYLRLSIAGAPTGYSPIEFSVALSPLLDRVYDFHNEQCLMVWLSERENRRLADIEARAKRRAEGNYRAQHPAPPKL